MDTLLGAAAGTDAAPSDRSFLVGSDIHSNWLTLPAFSAYADHRPVFLVGESHDSVPNRDGKLYLHIVPSPWGNASTGVYQVKITPRGEFGE